MRVLLVGDYHSRNLGDQLLCRAVEKIVVQAYEGVEIVPFDMSGKTGYDTYYEITNYSWLQRWYCRISYRAPFLCRRFALLRAVSTDLERHVRVMNKLEEVLTENVIDLAVFAGGSIFMDYFAAIINIIVKRLAKKKVPIMFHACGMSILSTESVKLIQKALKCQNVKWISLRDSYDKFCQTFKTRAVVKETNDTALYSSMYYVCSDKKHAEYGVGIMDLPEYYEAQKKIVQWFRDSKKTWKLFTNGTMSDKLVTQKLIKELSISEDHIAEYPVNPNEFIKTVTSFEKIVSFRMHTQIVAAAFGIPVYGMIWNEKVREVFRKIGFEDNCGDPVSTIDLSAICNRLNTVDRELLKSNAIDCGRESAQLLLEGLASILGESNRASKGKNTNL